MATLCTHASKNGQFWWFSLVLFFVLLCSFVLMMFIILWFFFDRFSYDEKQIKGTDFFALHPLLFFLHSNIIQSSFQSSSSFFRTPCLSVTLLLSATKTPLSLRWFSSSSTPPTPFPATTPPTPSLAPPPSKPPWSSLTATPPATWRSSRPLWTMPCGPPTPPSFTTPVPSSSPFQFTLLPPSPASPQLFVASNGSRTVTRGRCPWCLLGPLPRPSQTARYC